MADSLVRGHLNPATLTHTQSNIGDCFADPGALTYGQALHAQTLHQYCSPSCGVRNRIDEQLGTAASEIGEVSPDD
ncbi:hypothetical protein [Nocardia grenadensis]